MLSGPWPNSRILPDSRLPYLLCAFARAGGVTGSGSSTPPAQRAVHAEAAKADAAREMCRSARSLVVDDLVVFGKRDAAPRRGSRPHVSGRSWLEAHSRETTSVALGSSSTSKSVQGGKILMTSPAQRLGEEHTSATSKTCVRSVELLLVAKAGAKGRSVPGCEEALAELQAEPADPAPAPEAKRQWA